MSSDLEHCYLEIKDPVRNLHAVAHSKKSFTMYWEDPLKTNGLLKRYTIYWTRIPTWPLDKWETIYKVGQNWKMKVRHHSFNWTGDTYMTDSAPVIYWKIKLFGFVNDGPMSKTQAIRVCPGGKVFISYHVQYRIYRSFDLILILEDHILINDSIISFRKM